MRYFLISAAVILLSIGLAWEGQIAYAAAPSGLNVDISDVPSIRFSWGRVDDADDGYRIRVWPQHATNGPTADVDQSITSPITYTKVQGFGQNYKWQVASLAMGSEFWSDWVEYSTPPPPTQCSDNLDNDSDGSTDYPNDSDCDSLTDNNESSGGSGGPPGGPGPGGTSKLENPISAENITELFNKIFSFLFGLSIFLVPIVVIYAAFLMLMGGGDPEKLAKGRMILFWTAIAFILILLSKGLPVVFKNLL